MTRAPESAIGSARSSVNQAAIAEAKVEATRLQAEAAEAKVRAAVARLEALKIAATISSRRSELASRLGAHRVWVPPTAEDLLQYTHAGPPTELFPPEVEAATPPRQTATVEWFDIPEKRTGAPPTSPWGTPIGSAVSEADIFSQNSEDIYVSAAARRPEHVTRPIEKSQQFSFTENTTNEHSRPVQSLPISQHERFASAPVRLKELQKVEEQLKLNVPGPASIAKTVHVPERSANHESARNVVTSSPTLPIFPGAMPPVTQVTTPRASAVASGRQPMLYPTESLPANLASSAVRGHVAAATQIPRPPGLQGFVAAAADNLRARARTPSPQSQAHMSSSPQLPPRWPSYAPPTSPAKAEDSPFLPADVRGRTKDRESGRTAPGAPGGDDGSSSSSGTEEEKRRKAEKKAKKKAKEKLRDVTPDADPGDNRRSRTREFKLLPWPSVAGFLKWRQALTQEVRAASGGHHAAVSWLLAVESPTAIFESLSSPEAFPALDADIAAALSKIAQGEASRRIAIREADLRREGKLMSGRQMLFMTYQEFKTTSESTIVHGLKDLLRLTCNGDGGLERFFNSWNSLVASQVKPIDEEVLHQVFLDQIENLPCLSNDISHYRRPGNTDKTYAYLASRVNRETTRAQVAKNQQELQRANDSTGQISALPAKTVGTDQATTAAASTTDSQAEAQRAAEAKSEADAAANKARQSAETAKKNAAAAIASASQADRAPAIATAICFWLN